MAKWRKIPQEFARRAVADSLALFIGHGKRLGKSPAQSLFGCGARSLDNWLGGYTAPQHHEFMQMCATLGPDFVNAWLAHLGMTGARHIAPVLPCDRVLHSATAKLSAAYATALEDGHIDHRERADILTLARGVKTAVEPHLKPPEGA